MYSDLDAQSDGCTSGLDEDGMWKESEGKMRRKLFNVTVGPLVILMAIVQASSVIAAPFLVATTAANSDRSPQVVDINWSGAAIAEAVMQQARPTATAQSTVVSRPTVSAVAQITDTNALTTSRALTGAPTLTDTSALTSTTSLSESLAATVTQRITPGTTVSPAVGITATVPLTPVEVLDNATDVAADAAYAAPIEGTIIANRTDANVRFFVEGATYQLDPLRSIGVTLPRVTAVLNLFNCDANTPETTDGCFWDPYLLDRDGFYEIIPGADVGSLVNLTLQPAGNPPSNQIWLQNRTGSRESIFYEGETIELPPSSVREFAATAEAPALFYLRSCLAITDRTVCEWSPVSAEAGFYYALVETTRPGNVPNSNIETLELKPIISPDGNTIETPPQLVCQLQVPALNVRSGPGLEYEIISKVRGTEQEPGRITVIGRSTDSQWLAVDERAAAGGWVTGSASFVDCNGDISALPEAEVVNGRLAPTPVPVAAPPATTTNTTGTTPTNEGTTDNTAAPPPATEVITETSEPATPATLSIPAGQALIIINNGFDQQIRFTLDQRYRVDPGPSEYDLQPGGSMSLLVYPGAIAFSASSPWRGLSGNTEFFINEKESRTLWVIFVPDPDGSGRWNLQY